jgi:hypothetical protein
VSNKKSKVRATCYSLLGVAPGALAALSVLAAPTPSLAAGPSCTATAAQAVAPPGRMIGPISNLNAALPVASTGAVLVPAAGSAPSYCLVTGSIVTNSDTGKTANFGIALPVSVAWNNRFLQIGCGGLCGTVFATLPTPTGGGYAANAPGKGRGAFITREEFSCII